MSKTSRPTMLTKKRRSKSPRTRTSRDLIGPRQISLAKDAAIQRYKGYANVIGVSAGTKFVGGKNTENHAAILFYVRKKLRKQSSSIRQLPRFVYGRFANGKINRRLRFLTDVIEVGKVKMTCGASSKIATAIGLTRQNGNIALLFRNKLRDDNNFYLLSCAHVIGSIDGPTPLPIVIRSECSPTTNQFARLVFASVQSQLMVDFDVGIAQVNPILLPLPDLTVTDTSLKISSFIAEADLQPPLALACRLPVSKASSAVVASERGTVLVEYRKGTYEVANAWLVKVNRRVREGDSGGLLFIGEVGVGMIFASSGSDEGWAWFHPLGDLFRYINERTPIPLRCFD